MPVIGRLDEQVHDVLITPVSKRRRGGDDDDAARGRRDEPERRPPPPKPPEDESRVPRDELPVWLL